MTRIIGPLLFLLVRAVQAEQQRTDAAIGSHTLLVDLSDAVRHAVGNGPVGVAGLGSGSRPIFIDTGDDGLARITDIVFL